MIVGNTDARKQIEDFFLQFSNENARQYRRALNKLTSYGIRIPHHYFRSRKDRKHIVEMQKNLDAGSKYIQNPRKVNKSVYMKYIKQLFELIDSSNDNKYILCVKGPNGVGKTTSVRTIAKRLGFQETLYNNPKVEIDGNHIIDGVRNLSSIFANEAESKKPYMLVDDTATMKTYTRIFNKEFVKISSNPIERAVQRLMFSLKPWVFIDSSSKKKISDDIDTVVQFHKLNARETKSVIKQMVVAKNLKITCHEINELVTNHSNQLSFEYMKNFIDGFAEKQIVRIEDVRKICDYFRFRSFDICENMGELTMKLLHADMSVADTYRAIPPNTKDTVSTYLFNNVGKLNSEKAFELAEKHSDNTMFSNHMCVDLIHTMKPTKWKKDTLTYGKQHRMMSQKLRDYVQRYDIMTFDLLAHKSKEDIEKFLIDYRMSADDLKKIWKNTKNKQGLKNME